MQGVARIPAAVNEELQPLAPNPAQNTPTRRGLANSRAGVVLRRPDGESLEQPMDCPPGCDGTWVTGQRFVFIIGVILGHVSGQRRPSY